MVGEVIFGEGFKLTPEDGLKEPRRPGNTSTSGDLHQEREKGPAAAQALSLL